MSDPISILGVYQSQYGLLGAMAREIAEAVEHTRGERPPLIDLNETILPERGVFLFMNVPQSIESLPPALFREHDPMRAVLFGVDHPFALPDDIIDTWRERNGLTNLRVCMPCLDDVHLLRPRFPGLVHSWVPHGVPRSSLSPMDSVTRGNWDAREYDVVVTGSVRPAASIAEWKAQIGNPSIVAMVDEIVNLMRHDPHLGYLAAFDLVMGSRGVIPGVWESQKFFWHLVIAELNRIRRISLVRSLQGLRVGVFGSEEWEGECTGTIEYAGRVGYEDCADAFRRGRVALAWGPTQFVHAYSERIMQAMAGGACVVADDRLLVRRDFNVPQQTATLFDLSDPQAARRAVDGALADPDASVEQARRGRELVERTCLWEHRLDGLFSFAHNTVTRQVA